MYLLSLEVSASQYSSSMNAYAKLNHDGSTYLTSFPLRQPFPEMYLLYMLFYAIPPPFPAEALEHTDTSIQVTYTCFRLLKLDARRPCNEEHSSLPPKLTYSCSIALLYSL